MLKIAVAYNRPYQILPEYLEFPDIYVLISQGYCSLTDKRFIRNIKYSSYSPYINELASALYIDTILTPDITHVGLAHYHRYLSVDKFQLDNNVIYATATPTYVWVTYNELASSIILEFKQLIHDNQHNSFYDFINNFNTYNIMIAYPRCLFIMPINIFKEYIQYLQIYINSFIFKNFREYVMMHDKFLSNGQIYRLAGYKLEVFSSIFINYQQIINNIKIIPCNYIEYPY